MPATLHVRDVSLPDATITLDVTDLSNQPDKSANYKLSFASNRKEQFDLSGTFSIAPVANGLGSIWDRWLSGIISIIDIS